MINVISFKKLQNIHINDQSYLVISIPSLTIIKGGKKRREMLIKPTIVWMGKKKKKDLVV